MKPSRRTLLHLAAGATAAVVSRIARAQGYPTRPVQLLVGFPPGGGSDVAGRIIANRLSEVWGQQVAVENKPGAGGHLAIEVAAHANPDGYTMVLGRGRNSALRLDDRVYPLRSGSRSHTRNTSRHVPERVGCPELLAMEIRWGSDRGGQSQSGQRHVLLARRRDVTSSVRRALRPHGWDRHSARALPWRSAGVDRPDRRTCRLHVQHRLARYWQQSEQARCAVSRSRPANGSLRHPSCRQLPNPAFRILT